MITQETGHFEIDHVNIFTLQVSFRGGLRPLRTKQLPHPCVLVMCVHHKFAFNLKPKQTVQCRVSREDPSYVQNTKFYAI